MLVLLQWRSYARRKLRIKVTNMSGQRLKVLVSAYACSPTKGSEPGMGWGWVEAISKYHDLWIITEKDEFESEVEAELDKRPELRERMTFFYIAKNRHRTLRKLWPPSFYWFYRQWHRRAYELAVELDKEVQFDVCHQLNMIGYREPGYLWRLNRPFVWGPVGGVGGVPTKFYMALGLRGFFFHSCRNLLNAYQIRFHQRVKRALRSADVFITATSTARTIFLRKTGKDSFVINETGRDKSLNFQTKERERIDTRLVKFSSSGRHISSKALPIALRALAKLPDRHSWHFDIIGSGPMTTRWKRLAKKLGIADNCTWHGWLSQTQATKVVAHSDVFLFTSLYEGTPHAVMEALSVGIPVVCFDLCGQKDVVTKECGSKIPAICPKEAVQDFGSAIEKLVENKTLLNELSQGAARFLKSEEHTYETKARLVSELYEKAIDDFYRTDKSLQSESTFIS